MNCTRKPRFTYIEPQSSTHGMRNWSERLQTAQRLEDQRLRQRVLLEDLLDDLAARRVHVEVMSVVLVDLFQLEVHERQVAQMRRLIVKNSNT